MSFDLMGLSDETLRAVTEAGYETPTPIQKQAIPVVLQGRDVMGIAQTGTGKTAGFTLPMIDILSQGRARARMPRSLILEPTRELAAQVAESFETYGQYHKLSMALLIGGVSFEEQNKKLDRGVDVLIATPGRLLDHFERGRLMMSGVEILVVDEADRMLDMGFIPDIERICKMMPQRHQTLFFSATMPNEIKRLSDTFLDDPKQIEVARPTSPAETVEQFLVMVKSKEPKAKRDLLRKLIQGEKIGNAIVFCNRKKDVDIVAKSLKKHGHNAAALHGDMDQMSRTRVLAAFKADEITTLVASDVAARGLDIPAVSHVFNFDVPNHPEDYIHRIGRTGRAGRSGRSITLCSPFDTKYLAAVQDMIGHKIPEFKGGQSETDRPEAQADVASQEGNSREGSSRRRGRRRRGGNRNENRATAQEPAAADNQSEAQSKPKTEESAEQTSQSDRPRQSEPRDGRGNRQDNDRSSSRSNNRSNDNRNHQNRNRTQHGDKIPEPNGIKGLGDHTPAFLLQPVVFPSTKKSAADDEVESKAVPKKTRTRESATDKSDSVADKPARKPRTRKKTVKEDSAPETEEAVAVVAAEVSDTTEAVAVDGVSGDTPAKDKPKRKRAPRKRKTAAVKAAETAVVEAETTNITSAEAPVVEAEPPTATEPTPLLDS